MSSYALAIKSYISVSVEILLNSSHRKILAKVLSSTTVILLRYLLMLCLHRQNLADAVLVSTPQCLHTTVQYSWIYLIKIWSFRNAQYLSTGPNLFKFKFGGSSVPTMSGSGNSNQFIGVCNHFKYGGQGLGIQNKLYQQLTFLVISHKKSMCLNQKPLQFNPNGYIVRNKYISVYSYFGPIVRGYTLYMCKLSSV